MIDSTTCINSMRTPRVFLETELIVASDKNGRYRSSIQCSNILDKTQLIEMPRKSSTVSDLLYALFTFGIGTVYDCPKLVGTTCTYPPFTFILIIVCSRRLRYFSGAY